MKTTQTSSEAFPIRTVAALTGINPITLRTWERRYHLIEPLRTPKGHRLYSKEHISMLQRVVALLDRGIPISRINHTLIAGDSDNRTQQETEFWQRLITRMVTAVSRFNEATLEAAYNEAMALYPIETVTQRLLVPMLSTLGERWANAEGTIAEEHFFGVYLRNKLGARFHHRKRHENGPALICACMPGERHEAGLLLFALSAYEQGFRCILLGTDIPLKELTAAVKQANAQAIVLSASTLYNPDLQNEELAELAARCGVPVFVGGQAAVYFSDALEQTGAIALGTDINSSLQHISVTLANHAAVRLQH
ncbi:MerR family transcriptional regulator [Pseudomethylobacillus aquaticus]|uniref:MerR family transcriptional regulator n=1 Tax=Pseudomethylobacillus aquaticus TaxID=2676064 RepID=A0A3N0V5E5_9PROT|nr:MerR family transcriptional regulator [Pseudomethylobacillus aquaticus]ROH88030.1 MerR family transcriptional regulator [Pseudomethylobacillus aquaticus]